jgi:alkylation response protein AidB-like acyl-CoA dehydrogenase
VGLWERETATLPRRLARRRRSYREFARRELAPLLAAADADPATYDPRPLLGAAARAGLQSEQLPPPWGTMPLGAVRDGPLFHEVLKAEELTTVCAGLGLGLLAHGLGLAPLQLCGDLRTVRRWLVPVCRANRAGQPRLAAFAITEPAAGSDVEDTDGARVARFQTSARRVQGGYVLNGQKVFITGGAYADLVTLFATLEPDGGRPGRVDRDWTCFVVERGTTGFRTGRREHKLGQRAADATELFLDDVFVPSANLVGTERSGWALNRNVLNYSRLPVGAIAVGIARGATEAATAYCRRTRLGGKPLLAYQEVQLTLADLWLETMAMRAMAWQGARHIPPTQGISSAVKTFCGDRAVAVAARAIELLADDGAHVAGGVEKRFRDGRLNQIYEGTNQLNRLALVEALWETDLAPGPSAGSPASEALDVLRTPGTVGPTPSSSRSAS